MGSKIRIFLIFFLLFFLNAKLINAQSNNNSAQGWFCVKTTRCKIDNYQQGKCTFKSGHRVRLEIDPNNKPLPNNNETYLVECLGYTTNKNEVNFKCTTGSSSLDIEAFGTDNFSSLKNELQYNLDKDQNYGIFKIDNNQAVKIGSLKYKTGPSGGLIIKERNEPVSVFEWQSYVYRPGDHKFYFFQKFSPQPTIELGRGGQQQATSFDWINADKDCAAIRWDPAGRVFDALSLEPIPDARVFLTKDDGFGNYLDADKFELGIINPQSTNSQGGFSFYVSDGNYKLSIRNLLSLGYSRIATSPSEINSKYNRIYYYEENGEKKTFLYPLETGEIITQKGKIEYRDIPLYPQKGIGRSYSLKIISAFQSVDKLSGNMIFEGTVSHPFTKIVIKGIFKGKEEIIYQGVSDNFGRYQIVFPQKKGDKVFEKFKVDYSKSSIDLIVKRNSLVDKLINLLTKKLSVFGQNIDSESQDTISVNLDPLPTYLEGVAYDEKGTVISNAQVKVFIKGINVPYITVTTDEKGYYKIPSNNLPSLPYELQYQDNSGKTVSVSTSQFITKNQDLIEKNKTDFYSLKDIQGRPIVVNSKSSGFSFPSSLAQKDEKDIKTSRDLTTSQNRSEQESRLFNSGIILILAIIIFLLLIIAAVVYFYFYQKNSSSRVI